MIPEAEQKLFFEKVTSPLPKTLRLPEGKKQAPKDWKLTQTALPNAFFIDRENREKPLGKTKTHFCGQAYIQSLSSMLPAHILDPKPDEKILDLCAAPGSKTTLLSQKMNNTGLILANEPSSSRSKKLSANIKRMGALNTVMIQSDGTFLNKFFAQEFDKILLDAPCSSEGFGRKDAKFFEKMWSEKKIFEAAKLQKKLITSAFKMLAPGGEMVYSTCTSAPEENEAVIEYLLNQFPEAKLLPITLPKDIPAQEGLEQWGKEKFSNDIPSHVKRIWPHLETDKWVSESFFIAKIIKTAPLKQTPPQKPIVKNAPKILKKNQTAEIVTKLCKKFGLEKSLFKPFRLAERDGEIYIGSREAFQFCAKNLFRNAGLKILDKDQNLTTEFAIHFGKCGTKNQVSLSPEQADKFLAGYDFALRDFPNLVNPTGEIMAQSGSLCLGHFKIVKDKLKNKLDRDLVF